MVLADKKQVEGCKCTDVTMEELLDYTRYDSGKTIQSMIQIMNENNGIGLASPQVGLFKNFFIMKYQDSYLYCFNPKIIYRSSQKTAMKEGCLTYNTTFNKPVVNIMRPKTIHVEFMDEYGENKELILRGIEAKCFQHEFDHLMGKTIMFDPGKGV